MRISRLRYEFDTYGYFPYNRGKEAIMAALTKSKAERKAPKPKAYRFDARLNQAQKLLIQRAADLEGRSMSDFVLHSAQVAAERTIEERAMLILSARETEAFVDSILRPAEPGPVLRAAARRYKAALKTASARR